MATFSNTKQWLTGLSEKYSFQLPTFFFWFFLASFFIDRVVNHFSHFPFFIVASIVALPFLFLIVQLQNSERRKLNVLVFSFAIITIINSIFYFFDVKNISDFLFISLFFIFYFYYKNNNQHLKIKPVYGFLVLCIFLFIFTFLNINTSINQPPPAYPDRVELKKPEKKTAKEKSTTVSAKKSEKRIKKKPAPVRKNSEARGSINWKSNPQDRVEEIRNYHNGLFRIPHIASYFFGFLFLFFAYQYQKTKRILHIALLIVSLALCLYTGSRALLLAFILSLLLFLLQRKYLKYLLAFVIVIAVLILTNDFFIFLTKNTFLNQYFVFIETTTENFTRLSRFRLWYSWWIAMQDFGVWNIFIGKSYVSSLYANDKNLGYYIWFHNDFLSILYCYGLIGFALYIGFFIKLYRDNKKFIRKNIFIFIFFSSMVITALLNGFYYYFPVFLLYPFFMMIHNEKQLA